MALRKTISNLRLQMTYTPLPSLRTLHPTISQFQPSNRRPFTQTASTKFPRKGSEDRNSINTEATEYSKSGTDDQAAKNEEAAFDPSKTRPDEEKAKAGEGNETEGNPLDVSPANPEVSKQKPQGGAEKTDNKDSSGGRSGGGSPNKGKKLGER